MEDRRRADGLPHREDSAQPGHDPPRLQDAAKQGAKLVVFPECALSGYGFESLAEARPHAETLPGLATEALSADCRRLGVFAAFGLLEQGEQGQLFNSCALVGPDGLVAGYRKVHLPFLGVDRFATAGDRPFAVHDLGGLRVGMNICYDASFPESAPRLAVLNADLILLPTNWPKGAMATVRFIVRIPRRGKPRLLRRGQPRR